MELVSKPKPKRVLDKPDVVRKVREAQSSDEPEYAIAKLLQDKAITMAAAVRLTGWTGYRVRKACDKLTIRQVRNVQLELKNQAEAFASSTKLGRLSKGLHRAIACKFVAENGLKVRCSDGILRDYILRAREEHLSRSTTGDTRFHKSLAFLRALTENARVSQARADHRKSASWSSAGELRDAILEWDSTQHVAYPEEFDPPIRSSVFRPNTVNRTPTSGIHLIERFLVGRDPLILTLMQLMDHPN